MAHRVYAGTMALLFDLDGTLLDSVTLILASFRHTHRVHFGTDRPDEFWLAGIGRTLRDRFAAITDDEEQIEALIATYREHNLAHHDAQVRPYPRVRETLTSLAERGVPMALVTSKMRVGAEAGLRVLGLESILQIRVCGDDVARGKPDPLPVRMALEALGVDPAEAIFVGDSPHDIEAGQRAGVRTAAASWGPFDPAMLRALQPTYWLRSITDLEPLVDGADGPRRRR